MAKRSFDMPASDYHRLLKIFDYQAISFAMRLIAFVEMVRFELMTPCLQGRCSPN